MINNSSLFSITHEKYNIYYRFLYQSMLSIAGISYDIEILAKYDNLESFLQVLKPEEAESIKRRIDQYIVNTAIQCRIDNLINYLYKHDKIINAVLDFGCGKGYCLDYLKARYNCYVCGVDPYVEFDNKFIRKVNDISEIEMSFDIAIVTFSLHHIIDVQHLNIIRGIVQQNIMAKTIFNSLIFQLKKRKQCFV